MISLLLDSFLRNFDPLLFELDSSQICLQLSLVSGNGPPFLLDVSIRNLSKKKSDFLFLDSNLRTLVSFFSGLALAEMLSLYSKRLEHHLFSLMSPLRIFQKKKRKILRLHHLRSLTKVDLRKALSRVWRQLGCSR